MFLFYSEIVLNLLLLTISESWIIPSSLSMESTRFSMTGKQNTTKSSSFLGLLLRTLLG